jgi:hypothetical protein
MREDDMSRTVKIILVVVVIGLVVAGIWAIKPVYLYLSWLTNQIGSNAKYDKTLAETTAAEFVGLTVPEGFRPVVAAQSRGYTIVEYQSEDEASYFQFFFARNEAGDAPSAKQRWLFTNYERFMHATEGWSNVAEAQGAIRGQTVKLWLGQGPGPEGVPLRLMTTVFQGKVGPAMLLFARPVNGWKQDEIDAFLASIR